MNVIELVQPNTHTPIDKDQSLTDAITIMNKQRISRLPVVENGQLVGIITENDIADRLGSSNHRGRSASAIRISSIMSHNPITVSPSTDVTEAAKLLLNREISGLPIVEKNNVTGMITKRHLIRLCEPLKGIKLREIMTSNPRVASPINRLVNIQTIMSDQKISSMPVLDEGRIVGLITIWQIARALIGVRASVQQVQYMDNRIRELNVGDYMIHDPPILRETDTVSDASIILQKKYFHSVPIVGDSRTLTGIVTRTDLLRIIANNYKV